MLLVLLDTPCNKRRYQLNKAILGYGQRVQKSVYECQIDQAETKALIRTLTQLMNSDEDKIRLQPCCKTDLKGILVIGGPEPISNENHWLVL